jgi:lactaldehyde reductase
MILNETSYFGAGCRETIAVEAARRGFKKAFFVTDRDLIRFKVADKVIEVFEKNSIPYELFSDVKANPTITNVQNGVAAFKASGADFIVALGGGSSIDTAKGIGIVVNNPDFADVKSLEGVADTRQKAVPTFALPTFAFPTLAFSRVSLGRVCWFSRHYYSFKELLVFSFIFSLCFWFNYCINL